MQYLYNGGTFSQNTHFQWRCVTSQFKENAQNKCLSVPAPNAFYGDISGKVLNFICRISLIIVLFSLSVHVFGNVYFFR